MALSLKMEGHPVLNRNLYLQLILASKSMILFSSTFNRTLISFKKLQCSFSSSLVFNPPKMVIAPFSFWSDFYFCENGARIWSVFLQSLPTFSPPSTSSSPGPLEVTYCRPFLVRVSLLVSGDSAFKNIKFCIFINLDVSLHLRFSVFKSRSKAFKIEQALFFKMVAII